MNKKRGGMGGASKTPEVNKQSRTEIKQRRQSCKGRVKNGGVHTLTPSVLYMQTTAVGTKTPATLVCPTVPH